MWPHSALQEDKADRLMCVIVVLLRGNHGERKIRASSGGWCNETVVADGL